MANPFFPYGQPYGPPPFNHHLPYPHNVPNHPAYMWGNPPPPQCPYPPYYAPPSINMPININPDTLPRQTHANGPGTAIPHTTTGGGGGGAHQFSLPGGIGYVFPRTTTSINLITANLQPWANTNPTGAFQFKTLRVPVDMSVADLIEQLCPDTGPEGEKVRGKGLVECVERGGGRWLKGHEFWVGEGKGMEEGMGKRVNKPIKSYGWDQTRGEQGMPIWLSSMLMY